jgi:hypothetical protein
MMRLLLVCVAVVMCGSVASAAEKRYLASEEKDEISGDVVHVIALLGEDRKSRLSIAVVEKKIPVLTIRPADTIFPDDTNIDAKFMTVEITMRSNQMDAPTTRTWGMLWMDYKAAFTDMKVEEARLALTGDSLAIQFDKVGKRYRFLTSGDGMEGFADAVDKLLSHAATDAELEQQRQRAQQEADTMRVDELLRERAAAEKKPPAPPLPTREQLREEFDVREAVKNGTADGEKMALQLRPGVLNALSRSQIISRAEKAANFRGIKKDSDARRKPYIDAYAEAIESARR